MAIADEIDHEILTDPLKFLNLNWPQVSLYDKQVEIARSVNDNRETVVPAANKMGKDFVAGFLVLWFFMSRWPCRIVTTSAKDDHLDVLWGEMNRFLSTSKYPLRRDKGGCLVVNQREIRRIMPNGDIDQYGYIKGMVASQESIASMQGHHCTAITPEQFPIPRSMFVCDESSSVMNDIYKMASTWFERALIFGNTWDCENFFKHAVKGVPGTSDYGGDIYDDIAENYYRKVIHIRAQDSPNVRLGMREVALGRKPSGRVLVPGVKSYREYTLNRKHWDPIKQSVSLDAEFYEGVENRLYPKDWLDIANNYARDLQSEEWRRKRRNLERWMGIDPAQGGDDTAWTVIDRLGIVSKVTMKTPNTAIIPKRTLALAREYNVPVENIIFDVGGGGKQHGDRMRSKGYNVRMVGFGEAATPSILKKRKDKEEKYDDKEVRYAYKNRRAEMYGRLRFELLDPLCDEKGQPTRSFGIPAEYVELRRQLSLIPLMYDEEGRLKLPSKNKKNPDSDEITLTEIIGRSPDEAESLILATFGMLVKPPEMVLLGAE